MITPFGKFLRYIRLRRGERLSDMADKLDISTSYLSLAEHGNSKFSSKVITKFFSVYHLTPTEKKELDSMKIEVYDDVYKLLDELPFTPIQLSAIKMLIYKSSDIGDDIFVYIDTYFKNLKHLEKVARKNKKSKKSN